MRKPVMARRAEPRVRIERFARFAEGGFCTVVDFSYRYMLVRDMTLPRKRAKQLTIRLSESCCIVCKPIKGRPLDP